MIYFLELAVLVYFLFGIASLSLAWMPEMQQLSLHGRSLEKLSWPPWFYISKNYFILFYMNSALIGLTLLRDWVHFVYFGHALRRLFESLLMPSKTCMNLLHFLVGMTFYPAVWILLARIERVETQPVMVILMQVAMILQCFCHLQMARNKDRTRLPPFLPILNLVICPNYFLEIIIYVFLAIILKTWAGLFMALFVAGNQIISAIERKQYYQKNEISPKYAIIPYLI